MDNLIAIPVTIVAAIANIPYLDVVKIADGIAEVNPDGTVYLEHLGDPKGAMSASTAAAIIVSASLDMAASLVNVNDVEAKEGAPSE